MKCISFVYRHSTILVWLYLCNSYSTIPSAWSTMITVFGQLPFNSTFHQPKWPIDFTEQIKYKFLELQWFSLHQNQTCERQSIEKINQHNIIGQLFVDSADNKLIRVWYTNGEMDLKGSTLGGEAFSHFLLIQVDSPTKDRFYIRILQWHPKSYTAFSMGKNYRVNANKYYYLMYYSHWLWWSAEIMASFIQFIMGYELEIFNCTYFVLCWAGTQ